MCSHLQSHASYLVIFPLHSPFPWDFTVIQYRAGFLITLPARDLVPWPWMASSWWLVNSSTGEFLSSDLTNNVEICSVSFMAEYHQKKSHYTKKFVVRIQVYNQLFRIWIIRHYLNCTISGCSILSTVGYLNTIIQLKSWLHFQHN